MGLRSNMVKSLIVLGLAMRSKGLPSKRLLDGGFFDYVLNPVPGICPVKFCVRRSRKGRSLCSVHDLRKWRAQHPERAVYKALRDHARSRGIVFEITFEEFMEVAKDFPFHCEKPKERKDYLSIDRIDPRKGYVLGNIQALTVSENVSRENRFRHSPEGKYWRARAEEDAYQENNDNDDDEVPF